MGKMVACWMMVALGLMLPACSDRQVEKVVEPTATRPAPTTTLTPTPIAFNCDLLQHQREGYLLASYREYSGILPAITTIYRVPEERVEIEEGTLISSTHVQIYLWVMEAPYHGELEFWVHESQGQVWRVGFYSTSEASPEFVLRDVLTCLGMPTSLGHNEIPSINDAELSNRYGESVRGYRLHYPHLEITLVMPTDADPFDPDTKCYFLSLTLLAEGKQDAYMSLQPEGSEPIYIPWPKENNRP